MLYDLTIVIDLFVELLNQLLLSIGHITIDSRRFAIAPTRCSLFITIQTVHPPRDELASKRVVVGLHFH